MVSAGLAGGGMERAVTNLANYAAAQGHEVIILNLFKTEVFFDLHPAIRLIWPEINRQQMHRLVYAARLIPYIRACIRNQQPDAVLSFGEWFNGYVILATRGLRIPVFITDRMGPDMNLGWLLGTVRRLTYRYAAGIIAQTNTSKERLLKKTGSKNIKVIPNAVRPINLPNNPLKKEQIVVTCGRLSKEKGHIYLIRAFALLKASDWVLHIIGDGNERRKLEVEAAHLGIENKVIFHGHLKEFSEIYQKSSIFVLPSLYEGFPNALLEAMSTPIACISTNCIAGPSDIIEHNNNGILVELGSAEALREALERLMKSEVLRNRLAAEAYKVRTRFDFEMLAERYIEFLTNSISHHSI